MNNTLTIEQAGFALTRERPETLSFLASRSKSSARALTPSASDVFNSCRDIIHQLLCGAIETRTGAEFDSFVKSAFPKYVSLNLAMSQMATALVPRPVLERLTRESICEMEANFRDKGLDAFGSAVRDQAVFTVWTLRKISELVTQIVAVEIDDTKKQDDSTYCANFTASALVAQFGLDCLSTALEISQPVYPEVSEKLTEYMRAMVNAYAWARRGLEARVVVAEAIETIPALDDEDRALMDASFAAVSELLDGEGA